MKRYELIHGMDEEFDWRAWSRKIPFISFPEHFLVKVIPPFGGATARFVVQHKEYSGTLVSVYLDCYDVLGMVGEPYWEVCPLDGNVFRCPMDEVEELVSAINLSLEQQINEEDEDV